MNDYGVLVAGAGPGGAAAAIALARAGVSTVIVDRRAEGDRIGESLPPTAGLLLDRLNIRDAFEAMQPAPCYGNRSLWGGDIAETDSIRHPLGHGWHIDRPRFDAMLLRCARGAGCDHISARVTDIQRVIDRWHLRLDDGTKMTARVLLDATGRSAALARRLGAQRKHVDRLVAVVAFLRPGSEPARDSMTLVEAVENGWWYTAVLPDGRLVAAFMTDSDLDLDWNRALESSTETRKRIESHAYRPASPPTIVGAGSSLLDHVAGAGWMAVGDAAATHDPLSSHGITAAMAAGIDAAAAVQSSDFDGYAQRVIEFYALYLEMRQAYYAEERRWPEATFWRRRHAAA